MRRDVCAARHGQRDDANVMMQDATGSGLAAVAYLVSVLLS